MHPLTHTHTQRKWTMRQQWRAKPSRRKMVLRLQFDLELSPYEWRPYVMVWTSIEGPPRRWYKILRVPADGGDGRKGSNKDNTGVVEVDDIPLPADGRAWPADASVYFKLSTLMKGMANEDDLGYETAGVGVLNLAQLLSLKESKGPSSSPSSSGDVAIEWHSDPPQTTTDDAIKVPIVVYSAIGESWNKSKDVPDKGCVWVLAGSRLPDGVRFADPTPYDLTPGNLHNMVELVNDHWRIETRYLILANNNEKSLPSSKAIQSMGKVKPFMPEVMSVFAPVYANPFGLVMPEEHFLTRTTMYTPSAAECEDYLSRLLDSTLNEFATQLLPDATDLSMSEAYFEGVIKRQMSAPSSSERYNPQFNDVMRLVGRLLARSSNACVYHSDMVDLNKRHHHHKKHSLSHYDPSMKRIVESFGDPAFQGCGDCEDFTKDMARNYELLTENIAGFQRPLLRLIGEVCRSLYFACGTLSSVTSGSIQQDKDGGHSTASNNVTIGDQDDHRIPTGAHMFLTLVPRDFLVEAIARSMNNPTDEAVLYKRLKIPHGKYKWARALPVVVCEGTGHLMPLLYPDSYYYPPPLDNNNSAHDTTKAKRAANSEQKKVVAAKTHLNRVVDSIGISSLQVVRSQHRLHIEPGKRPSNFYRIITEMCPVGLEEEVNGRGDCTWDLMPPPVPSLGGVSRSGATRFMSLRKLRPILLEHGNTSNSSQKTPYAMATTRFKYQGVDITYLLNKESSVGMLLNPKATAVHEGAFVSMMRHLPPEPAIYSIDDDVLEFIKNRFHAFSRAIEKNRSMWNFRPRPESSARWVHLFAPIVDLFKPYTPASHHDNSQEPVTPPVESFVYKKALDLIDALQSDSNVVSVRATLEAFTPATIQVQIFVLVKFNSAHHL